MNDSSDMKRCGVGIRGVAMAIDSVVWFVLFLVAVTAVGAVTGQVETTSEGVNTDLTGLPALVGLGLWFVLSLGYHTLLEWRWGKTIGKALVAIRVVGDDGTPVTLRASAYRNVLRLIDWLPMFYIMGIVVIVLSGENRRLGDRLAATAVVR
jgi:uncharacterized RDD family membrane protein YckC